MSYEIQLIESLLLLLAFLIIRFFIRRSINLQFIAKKYSLKRKILINNASNIILSVVVLLILASIWGINQQDILIFVSSILTVIGVAFFAQWSLLSNITAGIIMFFNNTIRINEPIRILDKDMELEGIVLDIGLFSTHIQTEKNGKVSIANNILIQKVIAE
jgi:small-conductance mechanosensitive channel